MTMLQGCGTARVERPSRNGLTWEASDAWLLTVRQPTQIGRRWVKENAAQAASRRQIAVVIDLSGQPGLLSIRARFSLG